MKIINLIQKIVFILFILAFYACSTSSKETAKHVDQPVLYEATEDVAYEAPTVIQNNSYRSSKKKDYKISSKQLFATGAGAPAPSDPVPQEPHNTESYDFVEENEFLGTEENPLSTFSIDVDNASYTNTRRYINNGSLPPKDAVRIEEFINYFSYDYKKPKSEHPFSVNHELATCPWNKEHQLLHIGLQGQRYKFNEIAPMNLVFLLDVSGSMNNSNKLPLLKKAFKLLVKNMRAKDHVSIVVYAGAAGVVLEPTAGNNKNEIINALDRLSAGGSTAGGAGIKLAYKLAEQNLDPEGVNRIILATDGDFNVGQSSNAEMQRLVEEQRDKNIFMTVLGFGMGNYKDSRMEKIADHGNGNYFYIDTFEEAQKVLHTQIDGTLYTIAKDVKIQIEFNPNQVKGYRLIGYENRMLKKEDFNNDKKDAGELGAGHTVTAIYEIIPPSSGEKINKKVDDLKYQTPTKSNKKISGELATVKLRYKFPKETKSQLLSEIISTETIGNPSDNFNFSAAVAGYGMLLRDSKFKGETSYAHMIELAKASKGIDENGYRSEFIQMMKSSELLQN